MLIPFEPRHMADIVVQEKQSSCDMSQEMVSALVSAGAFTCISGDKVLGIGAVVPMSLYGGMPWSDGIGMAFMYIAADIGSSWPVLFRAIRKKLREAQGEFRRIESSAAFAEGDRMLLMLGFEYEGRASKFRGGTDANLYGLIRK